MKRKSEQDIMVANSPEDIFTLDLNVISKEKEAYLEAFKPKEYRKVKDFVITKKVLQLYSQAISQLQDSSKDQDCKIVQTSTCNYKNPPIPKGYKHVCGEWNNGFVIERDFDGSQFVWIPVGYLDPNGTIDGVSFNEKFGRRNYWPNRFSEGNFYKTLKNGLALQIESVKKYEGFYISRYNISKGLAGKPKSVKGVMPWVNISFDDAKKIAATIEDNEAVKSHLTYGAEYDSVLEWFIKSNARTHNEIEYDSTNWGNYWNTKNSPRRLVKTGSREEWCTNNIYDLAGNVNEWTQEQDESSYKVVRGGFFYDNGLFRPVEDYTCIINRFDFQLVVGFRATLWIK